MVKIVKLKLNAAKCSLMLEEVMYLCHIISGEPQPIECAQVRWVTIKQLPEFEFPKANKAIITALEELWQAKSSSAK